MSVHGLIRGRELELGRDPDTGGQVLYVLELAKALSNHPEVGQVDILTRAVEAPNLSPDYADRIEVISTKARIIRVPFGPPGYIPKEFLWEHLEDMVLGYLASFAQASVPDLIHSHYGDAGWVAMRLSETLSRPYIHSAHSLGRYKKATMLAVGGNEEELDQAFNFPHRIKTEESVLKKASLLVASTTQELEEQYALYDHFEGSKSLVIPPGTDISRFYPPVEPPWDEKVAEGIDRFLQTPAKPMLLSIGRAVPRKNLLGLVEAYGKDSELRNMANLVLIAGNRDDIRNLDGTSVRTWESILMAIDHYDLYGHVAIPKKHLPHEIPAYYRLAATRKGFLVNPSISETFGLTLIEAAASGLPVIATNRGGPRDIIARCQNGLLGDTRTPEALAITLRQALSHPQHWRTWSLNGLHGVREHFTWKAHVEAYLRLAIPLCARFPTTEAQGATPCLS